MALAILCLKLCLHAEEQSLLHNCAKEVDRQLLCYELCSLKQTQNTC